MKSTQAASALISATNAVQLILCCSGGFFVPIAKPKSVLDFLHKTIHKVHARVTQKHTNVVLIGNWPLSALITATYTVQSLLCSSGGVSTPIAKPKTVLSFT